MMFSAGMGIGLMFRWTFHPWAIYTMGALTIAYFTFRKGSPNLVNSAFLFRRRVRRETRFSGIIA